jgi:hypothetical protein
MPEKVPPSAIKFYEDRLVTLTRPDDQLALTPYLVGGELPSSTGLFVAPHPRAIAASIARRDRVES